MKLQQRTLIVFLMMYSLLVTSLSPFVCAEGESNDEDLISQGFLLADQPLDSANNISSSGNYTGNQTGGNNQNNSSQQSTYNTSQVNNFEENQTGLKNQNSSYEQGYNNENYMDGNQYRYRYQKRYMNIEGTDNCTRIRSQYRNNATDQTFEIFFTVDTAPTFDLWFIPSIDTTPSEHHFSLIIEQLIEYNDINANGKYDHNDIIVSSLNLSSITFTNITYTNSTTEEGKTITIIETHTIDNIFSIVVYLASEQTSLFNTIITPEEIKIDFNIISYPFVNQTSQLALVTQIDTPFRIISEGNTYDETQGIANQESGLTISSRSNRGFFSWANTAIIDEMTYSVDVTVVSKTEHTFTEENQQTYTKNQVIFSYPRGEHIIHDPKIGVADILENLLPSPLQPQSFFIIYLLTCVISAIVFFVVIRVKKKQ